MESLKTYPELSIRMKESFNFFKSLQEDEIHSFLSFCENRQQDAGDILWKEGDDDNYAAFVVSGKVGIKKKTEFEGKYMIVGTFSKGAVVGELCLLTNQPRSVTAVALEPVDIVVLTNEDFEKLNSDHPTLGLKLLKQVFMVISKRLSRSTARMAQIF